MTKCEMAEYLVNLHTLMDAQQATGANPSTLLADEYRKHWDLLKSTITKENEDEAGNWNIRNVNESRAHPTHDQSRRGSTARDNGDLKSNPT